MFFGIDRRAHLFCQQGTELGTVPIIDGHTLSPLGNVMRGGLGHAACHAGHQPGRTVPVVITGNGLFRVEGIVTLGQGMLDVVATRQRLGTQNVVQM